MGSEWAIQVNILIMRTFVKLKEQSLFIQEVFARMHRVEARLGKHDKEIEKVFRAIRCMLELPITLRRKPRPIGFKIKS